MKTLNFFQILFFSTSFVNAQFYTTVLQPKLEDYKPYEGIKQCEKYKLKAGKDSDNESLVNTWQYNKKGQPQLEVSLFESSDTISRKKNVYNSENQLIRSLVYAPNSSEEYFTEYSYNSKGLFEKSKTSELNSVIVKHSYDAEGNILESNAFQKVPAKDENGIETDGIEMELYKNVYRIDQFGRIKEFSHYSLLSNFELHSTAIFTYNTNGYISKYELMNDFGMITHEEIFSFDKTGKVNASKVNNIDTTGIIKTTYYRYEYK
jgi:hypothetical protein